MVIALYLALERLHLESCAQFGALQRKEDTVIPEWDQKDHWDEMEVMDNRKHKDRKRQYGLLSFKKSSKG